MNTAERRERRVLARDLPSEIEVASSHGARLTDTRGRTYIDFVMGWCVGNFGWQHPTLLRRAREFRGPDYVYPGYSYRPWTELAELLLRIAPGKLAKCVRATGGSEAVDFAMQAAMLHTGRSKFLSIEGAYHGDSLAALSLGGTPRRKRLRGLLQECETFAPPLDETALSRVEPLLKRRDVAALVMEPVVMNLGVLIPTKAFMSGVQRLCRRYGTLLVIDEVATGFGRTGRIFAAEHYRLNPDVLCLAKAITGGAAGLGATLLSAPVARSMEKHGDFYSTYGWRSRARR
jgi:adenosylmethionine-8-amino-7-oxononanoate aminotransferase